MPTKYQTDVVAWANEQAGLIRAGKFELLDVGNIAEELEDMGKSEQRELASRMAVLLAHLLKWQYQPEKRSKSWQFTIATQRKDVAFLLDESPSLKRWFADTRWMELVWAKARGKAEAETGLNVGLFPEVCSWNMPDVLQESWLPN